VKAQLRHIQKISLALCTLKILLHKESCMSLKSTGELFELICYNDYGGSFYSRNY
jgi:hypothetical protein